jgi:hypothetical protein
MSVRHGCPAPLTLGRAAVPPRHLGRGAGLVHEHQALGLEVDLLVKPGPTLRLDLRAPLLGGMRGLF